MSWDVSLKDENDNTITTLGNYTYNVSLMYEKAMGLSFSELHGIPTTQAVFILTKAINEMISNKDEYIKLNPVNGWGNYEGALRFLEDILKRCKENYKSYIDIS
jgi:hypothetical protein